MILPFYYYLCFSRMTQFEFNKSSKPPIFEFAFTLHSICSKVLLWMEKVEYFSFSIDSNLFEVTENWMYITASIFFSCFFRKLKPNLPFNCWESVRISFYLKFVLLGLFKSDIFFLSFKEQYLFCSRLKLLNYQN